MEKKRGCKDGKPCEILVVADGGKERWVTVSKSVWQDCGIGEWYEDELCGLAAGMRNLPAPNEKEQQDPNKRPNREEQDQNSREVCFEWKVSPVRRAYISIYYGRRSEEVDGLFGSGTRCRRVVPGQPVSMEVSYLVGYDTYLECAITQTTGRGGQEIDYNNNRIRHAKRVECSGAVR